MKELVIIVRRHIENYIRGLVRSEIEAERQRCIAAQEQAVAAIEAHQRRVAEQAARQ